MANLPLATLHPKQVYACDVCNMSYSDPNAARERAESEMTGEQREFYNCLPEGTPFVIGDVVRVHEKARGLQLVRKDPPQFEVPVNYWVAERMHGRMGVVQGFHNNGAVISVQYFMRNWRYNNNEGFVVEDKVHPEERCWLWKSYELVQLPQETEFYHASKQCFE